MNSFVVFQCPFLDECFVAKFTLIWFFTSVRHLVFFQMLCLLEIHLALIALEWSFTIVNPHVLNQDIFSGEDIWTVVALKLLTNLLLLSG